MSKTDLDAWYSRTIGLERKLNSFITIRSLEDIKKDLEASKGGALKGRLIAVKDNISTKGIRTTCASRMLENYVPPFDAHVIQEIKREGGVVIGKTNMDEFAMGSTTETSYFGPTRNPWDVERVPGGSSGGSGSAVASGIVEIALGSDTGGSIRSPASFTGVFGLKPSYGTVSRYGLVAYANSLEQIGPITKRIEDLILTYNVISGPDSRDATSVLNQKRVFPTDPDYYLSKRPGKLGVIRDILEFSEKPVKGLLERTLDVLSSEGYSIDYVEISSSKYSLPAYYIIAMSEASSNLARFDGTRYGFSLKREGLWTEVFSENRSNGFGEEVKRRIMLGSYILSAGYYDQYYLKALKIRRMIKNELDSAFTRYDALVSPTMPILPPKLGEMVTDPLKMYAMDVNTVIPNLTGDPAISIPIGSYNGLPVGLQGVSKYLGEETLFTLGVKIDNRLNFSKVYPTL